MSEKERNASIDALKGIACIAVVFMHCEFPGDFGELVQCLTRWSVPLFFTVSGYFFRKETVAECIRKVKHILKIIGFSMLFYVPFAICEQLALGGGVQLVVYFWQEFTLVNLLAWLVFNSPAFVIGQLWFLFALLYVYIAYAMMIRLQLTRYSKVLLALLLTIHFVLAYGMFLTGHPIATGFYRNFLFEGLPFFLMGRMFFLESQNWDENRIDKASKLGTVLICVGLIFSVLEIMWLGRGFSVHIASVIVLLGMLLWARKNRNLRVMKPFVTLGKDYSLLVYIVHIAVMRLFDYLLSYLGWNNYLLVQWLRPVNTLIWTVIVAIVLKAVFTRRLRGET